MIPGPCGKGPYGAHLAAELVVDGVDPTDCAMCYSSTIEQATEEGSSLVRSNLLKSNSILDTC